MQLKKKMGFQNFKSHDTVSFQYEDVRLVIVKLIQERFEVLTWNIQRSNVKLGCGVSIYCKENQIGTEKVIRGISRATAIGRNINFVGDQ